MMTGLEVLGWNGQLISPLNTCVYVDSLGFGTDNLFTPLYFFGDQKEWASCIFKEQLEESPIFIKVKNLRLANSDELAEKKRIYHTENEIGSKIANETLKSYCISICESLIHSLNSRVLTGVIYCNYENVQRNNFIAISICYGIRDFITHKKLGYCEISYDENEKKYKVAFFWDLLHLKRRIFETPDLLTNLN